MKKQLEEIKAENLEMKTFMKSKNNSDKIVEVKNKEIEKEIGSDMGEVTNYGTTEENKCEKCCHWKKQRWTENPCHGKT